MNRIRILLADDHTLVLAGIRALVERIEGAEIVGEAHNGRDALEAAKGLRPDLVIMDISMKELNGIDAAARIRDEVPGTKVLILSSHTGEEFVRRALRAGVCGYLVKASLPMELGLAVTAAMRGHTYVSPEVSRYLVSAPAAGASEDGRSCLDSLSPRQREVLQMIAEGNTTKEIAYRLGLSVKTVETHRAALFERLGIRDIAGLVVFAAEHGLITVSQPT